MAAEPQNPLPSGIAPDLRLPNLANPADRRRLTPAALRGFLRLAELWDLDAAEATALLGDISERSWYRLRRQQGEMLSQDVLMRISLLVGIYKALHLLFSEPLADEWVRLDNSGPLFAGQAPLQFMIRGGIPAMLRVRQHLDALRGGL